MKKSAYLSLTTCLGLQCPTNIPIFSKGKAPWLPAAIYAGLTRLNSLIAFENPEYDSLLASAVVSEHGLPKEACFHFIRR